MVETVVEGAASPDNRLVASLHKLNQTLHLINSLRTGVRRIFKDLTITMDPTQLRTELEGNTTTVKGDINALLGLVAELHAIVQDAEASRQGLLNSQGHPLPEGMLLNDISNPVSAAQIHQAYTWEKKVGCHGQFAAANAREEMRKFPRVSRKLVERKQGYKLGPGTVMSLSQPLRHEGERMKEIEDSLGWTASYDPRMDIVKETLGTNLVGLTVKLEGVLQALIVLRPFTEHSGTIMMVDTVCVCSPDEKINAWGTSSHAVFQVLTHMANAALLYFRVHKPNHVLSSFLLWLHGYHNLFSAECVACHSHLRFNAQQNQLLPPTWRHFTLPCVNRSPYHAQCVPSHTGSFWLD